MKESQRVVNYGVRDAGVQVRRQKNFQGKGATEKTRPKNSTIKPLSTLSVLC